MPSAWWTKGMTRDEAEFEEYYCNTSEEVDYGDELEQGPSKRPRRERPDGSSLRELMRYNREHHSVCRTKPGVYPPEKLARLWEFKELHPELFGGKRKRAAAPEEDQVIVDVTGKRAFDLIDNHCIHIDEPNVLATAAGEVERLPDTPMLVPVVPADAPAGDGGGAGDDAGSGGGGGAEMEAREDVEDYGGWASEEDYYDDDL